MKKRGGGGPRRYRATAEQPQDQRVHYNSAVAHCIAKKEKEVRMRGREQICRQIQRVWTNLPAYITNGRQECKSKAKELKEKVHIEQHPLITRRV
ncbi:uncharacterized protein [Anoplolepis gracilipes]|uniref:uncharacterized protein isoform X2 n=1 Tax=Anoplolepis gracilipes TaxID=354296 RepID=UPI003B9F15D4